MDLRTSWLKLLCARQFIKLVFALPSKKMPETMEISGAAKSGDGSLENVGIKLDGKLKCPHCRQIFENDKALQLHLKFQCSTAIATQINPIGD